MVDFNFSYQYSESDDRQAYLSPAANARDELILSTYEERANRAGKRFEAVIVPYMQCRNPGPVNSRAQPCTPCVTHSTSGLGLGTTPELTGLTGKGV